jgi:hypothetical protein
VKIFLLDDPAKPAEYALFSHVGTWADDHVCEECGVARSRLIEPLRIEWNEGTEVIGDFSWGGYHAVVLDSVKAFLENNTFEARFGRVEVISPTDPASRPRVPFPHRGPHLSWLIPTARVPLDSARSGVSLISDCSVCGQKRYTFKREGLWLPKKSWNGEKLFLIEQFGRSRATFITEAGLAMLTSAHFTNLCPHAAGQIEL